MNKKQLSINIDYTSKDGYALLLKYLKDQLKPDVEKIYQTLSKTGHFSHDLTTTTVKQFFANLELIQSDESDQLLILSMTILMGDLLKKAEQYETYRFRQNRFMAFFNELIHQGYPILKREALKYDTSFHEWYTDYLFQKMNNSKSRTPYESLLSTWLLCEEREAILVQRAEYLLQKDRDDSLFEKKLASLLFLQANDGARSLAALKSVRSQLHQSELVDHFLLMEQKQDYIMMKHWFELFFPTNKPKHGTVLGKIYEEMLIETGTEEEKITIVWKNWLDQPNFLTYKTKINKSTAAEKEKILNYIIAKLEPSLFRPQIEATYYRIMTEEELFEKGIHSLLIYKKEISPLSNEIQDFLKAVFKKQPKLLLPFYHQFVERLVQKKSRVHYEEAVLYIQQLKLIYEKTHQQELYKAYISGLKKRFKTFRAFIQELNKID